MHSEKEDYSYDLKTWHLKSERVYYIGSEIGLTHHALKIDR